MEYIYMNQFVTSDEPLDPEVYPIGSTLTDYKQGKYIPLNEDLINYMNSHPEADLQEVFLMHPVSNIMHIETLSDKANNYFTTNYNFIYINNEQHFMWEWKDILDKAELLKWAGRESIEFISNNKYFKCNVDDAINIMKQIGVYFYDIYNNVNKHYKYIEEHPNDEDYDYTTGYPEVPRFTIPNVTD